MSCGHLFKMNTLLEWSCARHAGHDDDHFAHFDSAGLGYPLRWPTDGIQYETPTDTRGILATRLLISPGGHISILRDDDTRIALVNLGPVLQLDQARSCEITPVLASELAVLLIRWALDRVSKQDTQVLRGTPIERDTSGTWEGVS